MNPDRSEVETHWGLDVYVAGSVNLTEMLHIEGVIVPVTGIYLPSAMQKPRAGDARSQAMLQISATMICMPCLWESRSHARDCSGSGLPLHDKRLCNNCYKPGHIAIDCTNDKACNNCRQSGHMACGCPNESVCNVCNVYGHLARQCPKTKYCIRDCGWVLP